MKKSLFIVTILLLTVFVVSLGLVQAKEYNCEIVPKMFTLGLIKLTKEHRK